MFIYVEKESFVMPLPLDGGDGVNIFL